VSCWLASGRLMFHVRDVDGFSVHLKARDLDAPPARNASWGEREGWFDALLLCVHDHPRAIRTMEYADYCEETWGPRLPEPYPSFKECRRNADSFVESPTIPPAGLNS
jgi:hypothetical protein